MHSGQINRTLSSLQICNWRNAVYAINLTRLNTVLGNSFREFQASFSLHGPKRALRSCTQVKPNPTRRTVYKSTIASENRHRRVVRYADVVIAYYSALVGVWSIGINPSVCETVCLYVCLSVCPRACLWNRWNDRHQILCADPLQPWRGSPPAALHYVMYFRFYG